jgi:hypothetical protein
MKVRLKSNQGSDEANFGSNRYRVANDGTVMVDAEAVEPLVAIGGFSRVDPVPPVEVAHGDVRVRNDRDPTGSLSWNGTSYEPDAAGIIVVPIESLTDISPHGFASVPSRRDA